MLHKTHMSSWAIRSFCIHVIHGPIRHCVHTLAATQIKECSSLQQMCLIENRTSLRYCQFSCLTDPIAVTLPDLLVDSARAVLKVVLSVSGGSTCSSAYRTSLGQCIDPRLHTAELKLAHDIAELLVVTLLLRHEHDCRHPEHYKQVQTQLWLQAPACLIL